MREVTKLSVQHGTITKADPFKLDATWLDTGPGERTYLHQYGDRGVPVVYLHGSGAGVSAAANWWRNLPVAGTFCRAIAFDLVGFGQTEHPADAAFGIRAWIDHTLRVLDALSIDKAYFVGNSLGGWIALQLGLDHPERVLGLVPMGTGGVRGKNSEVLKSHMKPAQNLRSLLEDFVVDPSLVTDELLQSRQDAMDAPGARERYAAVVESRERDKEEMPLDESRVGELACPVMLIHGREDRVISAETSWHLSEWIAGSDLHILSGCGHWAQIERHVTFNRLVADFVGADVTLSPGSSVTG